MASQSKKSAYVGLSGGVDSAVTAALLKKAGYAVTGVFIKVWQPDWIECNWKQERLEAMRVAAHLDIPFVTLDLVREYKQGVIDYMIAEYAAGRTPNPDVMCNREVKFGAFWRWAKREGADFIATGHYARIECADLEQTRGDTAQRDGASIAAGQQAIPQNRAKPGTRVDEGLVPTLRASGLLTGIDANKDQSYFLWTLNQDDLAHTIFPVGGMTKPEVRKLAKKFGLPNAGKKDSQGLCFIGKVDVKEFLKHYVEAKPGNVLNEAGKTIGKHPGALLFTIGERHGFTVTEKTPSDKPFFVVRKDIDRNTITVSNKDDSDSLPCGATSVRLIRTNWVSGNAPDIGLESKARGRYRAALSACRPVSIGDGIATFEFTEPQDTLTAGQSLVIYDGDECLGGGIIGD